MNMTTVVISAFAITMGLAATLVGWVLSKSMAEVPEEDRRYKDPPPLGFKLAWLPIQWLANIIAPVTSAKRHTATMARLRKAGLDYCLSPAQFIASRLVCALWVSLVFRWVLASFDHPAAGEAGIRMGVYLQVMGAGALFGYAYPAIWLGDCVGARRRELRKTFPFYLDIITLCVEAGLNMQGAMNQAVSKGPKGVVRDEFQRVLRDIRAGKARAEAL